MSYAVDFDDACTVGLESSPLAAALAGLRAHEARYTIDDRLKRAVGFKLSEGIDVPAELASKFKFARRRSKLAGVIRGSYFAFQNDY